MTRSAASYNAGKEPGWRVGYRAVKDGFAQRLFALTAHQDVTNFTDSKRSFVFVFLRPVSPKSRSPHRGAHPLRRELRTSAPLAISLSVKIRILGLADRDQNAGSCS